MGRLGEEERIAAIAAAAAAAAADGGGMVMGFGIVDEFIWGVAIGGGWWSLSDVVSVVVVVVGGGDESATIAIAATTAMPCSFDIDGKRGDWRHVDGTHPHGGCSIECHDGSSYLYVFCWLAEKV